MDYDPCAPIHSVGPAAPPAGAAPVHHPVHRFTGNLFGRIKASRPRRPFHAVHRAASTACERASKSVPPAAAPAPAALAAKPILLAGGALAALGGAGAVIGSAAPGTSVPAHGPPGVVNVPEPASIAMFTVAAIAALAVARFRRPAR